MRPLSLVTIFDELPDPRRDAQDKPHRLADILVMPSIDRMADLGLSSIWDRKYPAVSRWYERLQARPAFKATYYKGSRVSDFLELQPLYRPD